MDRFRRHLIRDALVLSLTLLIWFIASAFPAQNSLALLSAVFGVLCAFLFHEWGHWLGAWWSGAVISAPRSLLSPFLYNLDATRSSSEQFLLTSAGGFVATGLYLLVIHYLLPEAHGGTPLTERGALGLAALTLVFEVPIALAVAFGRPVPTLKLFPGP